MSKILNSKFKNIKAVITDVDGVLTDGKIYLSNSGDEFKSFNVKDGIIVNSLHEKNIITGVITGRKSKLVIKRCSELKINFHKHGIKNKILQYEKFKLKFSLSDNEICYIGDDINDLEILEKCAISCCPKDAVDIVKKKSIYISENNGGNGVFRDIADKILKYSP